MLFRGSRPSNPSLLPSTMLVLKWAFTASWRSLRLANGTGVFFIAAPPRFATPRMKNELAEVKAKNDQLAAAMRQLQQQNVELLNRFRAASASAAALRKKQDARKQQEEQEQEQQQKQRGKGGVQSPTTALTVPMTPSSAARPATQQQLVRTEPDTSRTSCMHARAKIRKPIVRAHASIGVPRRTERAFASVKCVFFATALRDHRRRRSRTE